MCVLCPFRGACGEQEGLFLHSTGSSKQAERVKTSGERERRPVSRKAEEPQSREVLATGERPSSAAHVLLPEVLSWKVKNFKEGSVPRTHL